MSLNRKSLFSMLAFYLVFIGIGCAGKTYTMAHPELEMRSKDIKTHLLILPDIKVYEFKLPDKLELRDDWSEMARENVTKAVIESLNEKQVVIKTITDRDKDFEEELKDITSLYNAVNASIQLHTSLFYSKEKNLILPEKVKDFDYSIGSIEKILKKYSADSLILVQGYDEISTGKRKRAIVAGHLLNITEVVVIAGAAGAGVAVVPSFIDNVPRRGMTAISIAVADSSGAILWHNFIADYGGYDLRKYKSTKKFIKDALSDFLSYGK